MSQQEFFWAYRYVYLLSLSKWNWTAPTMVGGTLMIDLKRISYPDLRSLYKSCSKKIWAEFLGTHTDSTQPNEHPPGWKTMVSILQLLICSCSCRLKLFMLRANEIRWGSHIFLAFIYMLFIYMFIWLSYFSSIAASF